MTTPHKPAHTEHKLPQDDCSPSLTVALEQYDGFRKAILTTIEDIVRPYKLLFGIALAIATALFGFFGLKEWPDFKKAINSRIDSQITQRLDTDLKSAQKVIEENTSKEISHLRDSVNALQPEIDRKLNQALAQTVDATSDVKAKLRELDVKSQEYESKMSDALAIQQRIQSEITSLQTRKSELENAYRTISSDQKELTAAVENAQEQVKKTSTDFQIDMDSVKVQNLQLKTTQSNLLAKISEIDDCGKSLAKTLGEEDFVVVLKKMSKELFRIQQIEARVQVSLPENTTGKLFGTRLAMELLSLQPNLSKVNEKSHFLEFEPKAPTTIGDVYEDGSQGTLYSETITPWEPFIENVAGKPIGVLNRLVKVDISSPPIPQHWMEDQGTNIDQLFSNIKPLKFQLYVNGTVVCEKLIKSPKYRKVKGRDEGDVVYSFEAIDLSDNFVDTRKMYEQRILADDAEIPNASSSLVINATNIVAPVAVAPKPN